MAQEDRASQGYWQRLRSAETGILTAVGARSVFPAGATLLPQQDTSGDVMFIQSGFTKVVTRTLAGRQVVFALRGPGDIVGEMSFSDGGRRCAAVAAITKVEAVRVAQREFCDFLAGSPHADELLRHTLVERLREADRDRLAAAVMTVGQRLARLLLKLVNRYGVPNADGDLVIALLTQRELAACVGGALRTVAREMGLWRNRRIISTTRQSVTVHQPETLARIAGNGSPPP